MLCTDVGMELVAAQRDPETGAFAMIIAGQQAKVMAVADRLMHNRTIIGYRALDDDKVRLAFRVQLDQSETLPDAPEQIFLLMCELVRVALGLV